MSRTRCRLLIINFCAKRILSLSVAVGLVLIAFAGASLAANVSNSHAQTTLYRTGGDSPERSDNPGDDSGDSGDGSGNKGEFASGGGTPSSNSEAAKQSGTGARAGSLPFSGYLAIPVLLIGVAMLGTGFVLRRRAF